ncbi:MAG: acetyl-CoA C-acetyltransferase [Polyangiaceae bacterium]|nr:acetyl-CoA C-acetyltransferase [Polyangiaceae bacterium]
MNDNDVYILAARRTPIGSFLGALSTVTAPQLGAVSIEAALTDSGIAPDSVDEVMMGNVLSAGIGQAPARQASLGAKLPASIPTTTISRVCGSGLQALLLGDRAIRSGDAKVIVAGGMENMSQVPHYLPNSRVGQRLGNASLVDGMVHDGLWDPYNNFHMGEAGELCAEKYQLSREDQDAFARASYEKALAAQKSGAFDAEIAPVTIPNRKGEPTVIAEDEEPGRGRLDKFAKLRPVFKKDGTITAANASSINDGAAACVLASGAFVREKGLQPLAKIVGKGLGAQAPEWFTTAPVLAIKAALERANLEASDIDLWEINEAFSCVTQSCASLAGVDLEKVNINGGAVALGHPIGASGARILTTLIHALKRTGKKRGLATLCIGGGEGVALIVESINP